jgi:putative SOS response-associated peptidase YedK
MARYFDADPEEETGPTRPPSYNVAPTDQVLGVRDRPGSDGAEPQRLLMSFRWGLIPWWSKDTSLGGRLFNARGETLSTKRSFREAFEKRRIIIPADGFYEWKRNADGSRQPHFFTRADGAPMAFAGLAERWRDPQLPKDAPLLRTCTIVTTNDGPDMEGIHDRMPVVLNPDVFDLWLDPANEDVESLRALLRPAPAGTIIHHAVSSRVGNVRNNDPTLLEPA